MKQSAREFLRAVRGKRSQVAFARRLGYRGNPIADWEAGRRCPTAVEALRACSAAGINVPRAFARFQKVPIRAGAGALDVVDWLNRLRGATRAVEIARRSGRTRHQVARWLSGKTHPRLVDFFALVQAISGRLCDLVAELVPIERVPSLRADYERRLAARRLAHEEPWTEAVLRILETDAYQRRTEHEPGIIARTLGIPIQTEQRCIQRLEDAGVIARTGTHYIPAQSLTVETRALPQLKAHWSDVARQRLAKPAARDVFCYNVLSASLADVERIQQLLLATYREVRTIVEHTSRDEAVALVNLQLVCWDSSTISKGCGSSPSRETLRKSNT